jgi:TPR repeat protein
MRNVIFAVICAAAAWASGTAVAQPAIPEAPTGKEQACESGDASACGHAATAFIGSDAARARALLDRGCAGGDRRSCDALGLVLVSGEENNRDYSRAAPLLNAACNDDVGASCSALANMAFVGVGVPADPNRALALAEKGCVLDNARACATFGLLLSSGEDLALDLRRAGPPLVKACAAAVPSGCEILEKAAALAVQGEDPRMERAAGLELFDAACTGGQPRACGALGAFLAEGLFDRAEPIRASAAFERGCTLNHAMSCASLAEAYQAGRGVSRDKDRARSLAEKALAIDPGNAEARRTLRRLQ